MNTSKEALLVFAKRPRPGRAKTRLGDVLTPAESAQLYASFLTDAARQYRALGRTIRYHVADLSGADEATVRVEASIPAEADVFDQIGEHLGPRMLNAFIKAFRDGFERVVVVGTDHPTLPTPFLELAFEQLTEPKSIVIGPSSDGGYYLLGMNELYPELFEGMTYSHDRVFEQTMERASITDGQVVVLPEWWDVDTPGSLMELYEVVRREGTHAIETARTLRSLARKYGWA